MTIDLIIADVSILQDAQGRYSLNSFHRASGSRESKKPSNWLDLAGTQELIAELVTQRQDPAFDVVKGGNAPGTYDCATQERWWRKWRKGIRPYLSARP
jgi:hypothetical protein